MKSKIKILRDEIAFDGRFVRFTKRHFLNRNGYNEVWEMIERKTRGTEVDLKLFGLIPHLKAHGYTV